jgi:GTPase SAR1 family protein
MDDESALCPRDEARKSFKSRRMKVISFGPEESGKSCIIKRFCEKRFVSKYLPTIGIDYGVTKFQFEDEDVKIDVFDLAGQPFFYEVCCAHTYVCVRTVQVHTHLQCTHVSYTYRV